MATNSYDFLARNYTRVKELAVAAQESRDEKLIALRVLASEMLEACDAYLEAHKAVLTLKRRLPQEKEEAEDTFEILAKYYEQILPLAKMKVNFMGYAVSSYTTDDDFLRSVENLEMALTACEKETWVRELLPQLSEKYDRAIKEYADTIQIRRDIQKAQQKRAKIVREVRDVFLPFRRTIRAVYGKSSKEYRSILDQEYRNPGENEGPTTE